MRNLRVTLLAGAGAAALAGGVIAPGVAGAAGASTHTISPDERVSVTATADDAECTVDFVMDAIDSENANWVADYRVDDEEPNIPNPDDEFFHVYNPVVTNQQHVADALNDAGYIVGLDNSTVDLSGYGPGEHTVTFKLYRGPSAGNWTEDEKKTGTVVIDCPGDEGPGEEEPGDDTGSLGSLGELGDPGSLDLLGSLEDTES